MQKTAEDALKNGIDRTKAVRDSVIIIEANSGAIKAWQIIRHMTHAISKN